MTLRMQVIQGVFWSGVQTWGRQAVSFLVFLVLARLLEPSAFGLVALASVFIAFVQIFLDQGFGDAVVQRPELDDLHLDTAFWTNLGAATVLTFLGIAISKPVAALFEEPQLAAIVRWLCLGFFFNGLSGIQQAILRRGLAFKKLAVQSLIGIIVGGTIGVIMALRGLGVWSLVGQNLINSLVSTGLLWAVSDWRPRLRFSSEAFRELFSFGVNITGANFLGFFNRRSDDLLIGYFLGPTALGYYTIAYRLLLVMTNLLTTTVAKVALPTFSRLQDDRKRLRRTFSKAIEFTGSLAFPAFIGVVVTAPILVPLFYGPKWEPSVSLMQILSFIGILHATLYFNSAIILAVGKPAWHLRLAAVNAISNTILFLIAVRWGIMAVAAAYVVRGYILLPLEVWVIKKLVRIRARLYLDALTTPIISSGIMALIVLILRHFLHDRVSLFIEFGILVTIGSLIYLITVWQLSPAIVTEAKSMLSLSASSSVWRPVPPKS